MPWSVGLSKDRFKFSATHFTIFSKENAERLHGHNYQVSLNINFKSLDPETGLAVELKKAKNILKTLCDRLDEKVLLPTKSPFIRINQNQNNMEIQFKNRFYSFPKDDCEPMDIVNTSLECLSQWFHGNLKESLEKLGAHSFSVTLEETKGQFISYT